MASSVRTPRNRKRFFSRSPNTGRKHRIIKTDDYNKEASGNEVALFQERADAFLKTRTISKSDGATAQEHDATGPEDSNTDVDAASVFFELANSSLTGYRINKSQTVVIRQDNNCNIHTGGIVWETSYLLAEFLTEKYGEGCTNHPLGKTLEIGAGCGMLGLVLAANGLSSKVVLTEASEVMTNLKKNVDENVIDDRGGTNKQIGGVYGTKYQPACPKHRVSVQQLRWDHLKTDIKACADSNDSKDTTNHDLAPHTFDTIIGTDVVFSPSLVRPLLKTISKMAKKKKASKSEATGTLIYLCLQVRCPDSHALLFSEAPKHGLEVKDVSDGLKTSRCAWGLELECVILRMKVVSKKHSKGKI